MDNTHVPKIVTRADEMSSALSALSDFLPSSHTAQEMITFAVLELFKVGFLAEDPKKEDPSLLVNRLNTWVGASNMSLSRKAPSDSVRESLVFEFVAVANVALRAFKGHEKDQTKLEEQLFKLGSRVPPDMMKQLEATREMNLELTKPAKRS